MTLRRCWCGDLEPHHAGGGAGACRLPGGCPFDCQAFRPLPPLPAEWKARAERVPILLDFPRHFWPARRGAARGVFPCGVDLGAPALRTSSPAAVTCRRCVRSRLVQALLRAGAGECEVPPEQLAALGLVRFP